MENDLQSIIQQHVYLKPSHTNRGWFQTLCRVCNDHGKKGLRAAFKMDSDGSVGYNCFNCGAGAQYHPGQYLSKNMENVLLEFDVPEETIQQFKFSIMREQDQHGHGTATQQDEKRKQQSSGPQELELPDYFVSLKSLSKDDPLRVIAEDHLHTRRAMTSNDYPFYIGIKTDHPDSKRWYCRLVIPCFKNNKIVFYQGYDLTETRKRKYISVSAEKGTALYGYNSIFNDTNKPIYVTEGFFDSYHIDGVGVIGRTMSNYQINVLNKSKRPKVVVPDKSGEGHELAEQGLEQDWSISLPDIGSEKDVCEGVVRFGKLYMFKTLRENTFSGFEAQLALSYYTT